MLERERKNRDRNATDKLEHSSASISSLEAQPTYLPLSYAQQIGVCGSLSNNWF